MMPGPKTAPLKTPILLRFFALFKRAFTSEPSTATAISKIPAITRTLILSFAFLVLLLPVAAEAQIAIGTVRSAGDLAADTINITSVSISGSNRALVVAVCFNNNDFEEADTVVLDPGGGNETSLTWLNNAAGIISDDGYCAMFGVANPPVGTFTVQAKLCNPGCSSPDATGGGEALIAGAWPLTGVDQTTAFGTAVGADGASSTASVTVGSAIDDLVFAAGWNEYYSSGNTMDTSGTGIEDYKTSGDGGSSTDVSVGQHKAGEASDTTLTWTHNSNGDKWAAIGVAVKPARTTIGDGTSPANSSPAQGSTNNAVNAFTLSTDSAGTTDTVTALTVTFSGTAVADVATNGVKIWEDDGSTANEWDASDTQIGSAVSFSGSTASFTGLNISVTNTSTQYLVTYDIAAGATVSNTLQGSITAATVSNILTNNDNTDNTLTVTAGGPARSTIQLDEDDIHLVYGISANNTPVERIWDDSGSSWSSEYNQLATGTTIEWMVTKAHPAAATDELITGVFWDTGSGTDIDILRYNGTNWITDIDSVTTGISSSNSERQPFDIAYEQSSGDAMIVYCEGGDVRYRTFNGATWAVEADVWASPPPSPGSPCWWIDIIEKPSSNEITLLYMNSNNEIMGSVWDGTQWVAAAEIEFAGNRYTDIYKSFAGAYETNSGDFLAVYGKASLDGIAWRTRASGSSTWSGETTQTTTFRMTGPMAIASDPAAASNNIALVYPSYTCSGGTCDDLVVATWDGTDWVNEVSIDTDIDDPNFGLYNGSMPVAVGWVGDTGKAVAVYQDGTDDDGKLDWATWTSGGGWVLQTDATVSPVANDWVNFQIITLSDTADKIMLVGVDDVNDLFAKTYDGTSWTDTEGGSALNADISDLAGIAFSANRRLTSAASCPGGSVCWDGGGGTNDWSEGANWTGDAVPGTTADVVFNGLSTQIATFDAVDTIGSLTIEAAYTGTITMAADLTNTGTFTQNGGTIDLGSTTFTQEGTWTYTAGTFTAGTSTVQLVTGLSLTVPGIIFNDVIINSGSLNDMQVIGTMDVDGDLTISAVRDLLNGTITAAGNVTSTDASVGGTGSITLDGANAQAIDINTGDVGDGLFTINKTNPTDTVTLSSAMNLSATGQDLTITQGILALGANNLTVNDVLTVGANGDITCTSGTVTAGSEAGAGLPYSCVDTTPDAFDFADQTDVAVSTQTESDIVQVNGMDNGTAISIDGSYEYQICSTSNCSAVEHTYTNSSGSIDAGEYVQLRLTSSASINTAIVATLTVGTLAVDWSVTTADCPGGSVCWDGGGGTNNWSEGANWTGEAVPGTAADVVFNGISTKNATFNAIDTIGSLTIEAAYTGTITMSADLTNTGTFTQNGGTIDLGATTFTQEGTWTYTAGTFTAGTSTVQLVTGLSLTVPGIIFNDVIINSGSLNDMQVIGTMDVDGDLTISAVRDLLNGTITVAGNVTSTEASVGGTGSITLDGANAQAIDINTGDVGDGLFTINKTNPTDTVTLTSAMNLSATGQDLTITQGILALGANNLTVNDVLTVGANGDITCTSGTVTAGSEAGAGLPYSCVPDGTAPVLATAAVNGTSLVLTYTELNGLDTDSTPANGDFSIGTDGPAQSVTGVVVNANDVTLTLSPAVGNSDTITVSYTAGANKIQDVATNAAANLVAQAVTNNTPAPTTLYRSVGTDGGNLNTGQTVEIVGTTATFSAAMPNKIGVGDVLEYGSTNLAFISGRTSSSVYTVQSATGGTPVATGAGTTVSVFRAYTSLFNWEAQDENDIIDDTVENFDTSTTLVADNTVMQAAAYADGVDTAQVTISGWDTGPSNYIRIFTPVSASEVGVSQRHDGTWGTGYRMDPSTDGSVLGIIEEYTRIEGIAVYTQGVNYHGIRSFITVPNPGEIWVSHCLVRGTPDESRWGIELGWIDTIKIWNNIVYDFTGTNPLLAFNSIGIYVHNDGTKYIYNNTVLNSNFGFAEAGAGGTQIAKNNVAINNLDNWSGTWDGASTNNASSSGDAPGSNPISLSSSNVTDYFVSATDFHIAGNATNAGELLGGGTDLSTDLNLPVSMDIDSNARDSVQPDVGADEFLATLYRSVGTDNTDLNTGQTVEIVGTTATFSAAMPDKIGVGDVLEYGSTNLAFIHGRTSDTVYTVQSATGGTPVATGAGTTVSVFRAYTSLFNWEAQDENDTIADTVENFDTSTTLVANNTVMQVAGYADGPDTSRVNISGWDTGPSNYIRIFTPVSASEVGVSQRHNGTWGTGYRIDEPTTGAYVLAMSEPYTRIEGIAVYDKGGDGAAIKANMGVATPGDIWISHCLVRGTPGGTRQGIQVLYVDTKIFNNIVYDVNRTVPVGSIGIIFSWDGTKYIYNNTVVDGVVGFYVAGTGYTVIAKNNIAINNDPNNWVGTYDAASTNNGFFERGCTWLKPDKSFEFQCYRLLYKRL